MHLPPAPFRCIAAIEAQPREIAPLSGLGKKHMQAKKHIQLGQIIRAGERTDHFFNFSHTIRPIRVGDHSG